MNATNVVLPYNETAIYEGRIRLGNVVTKFDYSLSLLTVVPAITLKIQADIRRILKVEPPAGALTLASQTPAVSSGSSVQPSITAISVAALQPAVSSGYSGSVPLVDIVDTAVAPVYVGTAATVVQPPQAAIVVALTDVVLVSGASVAPPTQDLIVAAIAPIIPRVFDSLSFATPGTTSFTSGNFGYSFTVGASDLLVNSLSLYAPNSTGSETVRIWRNSDDTLITSASVLRVINAWSNTSIAPVTLSAGAAYTISYASGGSRARYFNPSGLAYYGGITFNASVFNNTPTARPTDVDSVTNAAARFGYA
jgi:hypothetical protein